MQQHAIRVRTINGNECSYTNWQTNEPNNAAEPYADMEINRSGRTNGGWNDLRRIPNCSSGGLRLHYRLCC